MDTSHHERGHPSKSEQIWRPPAHLSVANDCFRSPASTTNLDSILKSQRSSSLHRPRSGQPVFFPQPRAAKPPQAAVALDDCESIANESTDNIGNDRLNDDPNSLFRRHCFTCRLGMEGHHGDRDRATCSDPPINLLIELNSLMERERCSLKGNLGLGKVTKGWWLLNL